MASRTLGISLKPSSLGYKPLYLSVRRHYANEAADRIQQAKEKAKDMSLHQDRLNRGLENAFKNAEGRRRLNDMAVPLSVYHNPVPYRKKAKQDTAIEYIQFTFAAFYQSRDALVEYFKTPKWSWKELSYRLGFGQGAQSRTEFLQECQSKFDSFKQAEVVGNQKLVDSVSVNPIRKSVLKKLSSPTRNSRLRLATWERTKTVSKPKLISFFKIPVHEKLIMWHALVRFQTEQTIRIPAASPEEKEIVKTQVLVENVLFEKRDWTVPSPEWKIRDFVPFHGIKEEIGKELPVEQVE